MCTELPTAEDINVHDSLDEQSALRHFLGKSLDEAEALFRDNSIYYQEDLMFMGPTAFRYYVRAAINYLRSEAATEDMEMVSCFETILQSRLEHEPKELLPIAPLLTASCRYVLEHYDRFDRGDAVYRNVRKRYQALEQKLSDLGL